MNTFKKTTLALAVFTLASGAIAQTAPAPAPAQLLARLQRTLL